MYPYTPIPRGRSIARYILLGATLLSCPSLARAQTTAAFGNSDREAIERLLDRYVRAYSTKDYAALRECIQAPFIRFLTSTANWYVLGTMDDAITY